MYTAVRQIIVNGLPVDINLATVKDLEGMSLIATFTSPLTGKSYALFEKLETGDSRSGEAALELKMEESMDGICLRACRALFEREAIVTHVLYKDYLLSRSREESAATAAEGSGDEVVEDDKARIEVGVAEFLKCVEKHRRFEEYLRRSGQA